MQPEYDGNIILAMADIMRPKASPTIYAMFTPPSTSDRKLEHMNLATMRKVADHFIRYVEIYARARA